MFTQCSKCETLYRLNVGELRIGQGQIKCTRCGSIFNALAALTDSPNQKGFDEYNAIPELDESHIVLLNLTIDKQPEETTELPWEKKPASTSLKMRFVWNTGTLFLILLLASQIIFSQGGPQVMNSFAGPWLSKICDTLNCPPKFYKNVALFDVEDHSLFPKSGKVLKFHALIENKAQLMLPYPAIQLTLLTHTGDTMAERVFRPENYLSANHTDTRMHADQRIDVNLEIIKPDRNIGGYTIKLI